MTPPGYWPVCKFRGTYLCFERTQNASQEGLLDNTMIACCWDHSNRAQLWSLQWTTVSIGVRCLALVNAYIAVGDIVVHPLPSIWCVKFCRESICGLRMSKPTSSALVIWMISEWGQPWRKLQTASLDGSGRELFLVIQMRRSIRTFLVFQWMLSRSLFIPWKRQRNIFNMYHPLAKHHTRTATRRKRAMKTQLLQLWGRRILLRHLWQ